MTAFLRAFIRSPRAGAGIETALGAAILITVSLAVFDIYSRVRAAHAASHAAVSMASYLSQEDAPDGDALFELGTFLHEEAIAVPSSLLFVLTAVRQPLTPRGPRRSSCGPIPRSP